MVYEDNIELEGDRKVRSIVGELLELMEEREAYVISRAIRSTGDLDLVGTIRFSKNALTLGPELVKRGVLVDTRMAKSGIGELAIYRDLKSHSSKYKSIDVVDSWKDEMEGKAVLIGTSPLALMRVLDLAEQGIVPGLVIGVPVGFVNALKAKYRLYRQHKVEYITNISVKGGVGLGVSIVRALMEIE
ncbi:MULTISPECIES: precorrin-8X methylmutase [Metallosphaera]|uniref:Precorrin-8X methylmutase n=1 Tax=Metallosphaera cuprina (strain Ar-4) TaxID=1006006 RepID=F4FYQ8_METCR|nr:precorrin-8X methylmutase [Metallosphaera cuprina]AEB94297.1 precorrin-8X methylmutase [Metallosphaera cuprina Ar-4]